jgi:hypothetical protein
LGELQKIAEVQSVQFVQVDSTKNIVDNRNVFNVSPEELFPLVTQQMDMITRMTADHVLLAALLKAVPLCVLHVVQANIKQVRQVARVLHALLVEQFQQQTKPVITTA